LQLVQFGCWERQVKRIRGSTTYHLKKALAIHLPTEKQSKFPSGRSRSPWTDGHRSWARTTGLRLRPFFALRRRASGYVLHEHDRRARWHGARRSPRFGFALPVWPKHPLPPNVPDDDGFWVRSARGLLGQSRDSTPWKCAT
jgi:hypothetical protein